MSPEQDDFLDEEEREEYAPRSIFAAGWFRAVLVLTVLAIVVVVSLPYLLNWFEPAPSTPSKTATRAGSEPAKTAEPPSTLIPASPAPTTSVPAKPEAAAPAPAPVTPAAPAAPSKPGPEKAAPAAPPTPSASAQAQSAPEAPAKPLLQPPASKSVEASRRTAAVAPKAEPARPSSSGSGAFYVQVGLFKEPANAQALAKALSAQGFPVETTRVTRGGTAAATSAQRHELFITGSSAEAVNAALKGRGVAQAVQGGVSVRPAYDLKQATSLSKELSAEGLNVVIRRAGRSTGDSFTLVRVGGFPDRAKALAAREELQGKGHAGFLTQGAAK